MHQVNFNQEQVYNSNQVTNTLYLLMLSVGIHVQQKIFDPAIQPCKQFGSGDDLRFMFGEMIQRSEQLYLTPLVSVGDDRLFYLPTFLDSLASIVHEIEQVRLCIPRYMHVTMQYSCCYCTIVSLSLKYFWINLQIRK